MLSKLLRLFKSPPPSDIPYFISYLKKWHHQASLLSDGDSEAKTKWFKELPKVRDAVVKQLFKEIPSLQSIDATRVNQFTFRIERINNQRWGVSLGEDFQSRDDFKSFLLEAQIKEEEVLKMLQVFRALYPGSAEQRFRLELSSSGKAVIV